MICYLNTCLRMPPLTDAEDAEARSEAQVQTLAKIRDGHDQHVVDFPAFRIHGPMWFMIDAHGQSVRHTDKGHPVGPGTRHRSPCFDFE